MKCREIIWKLIACFCFLTFRICRWWCHGIRKPLIHCGKVGRHMLCAGDLADSCHVVVDGLRRRDTRGLFPLLSNNKLKVLDYVYWRWDTHHSNHYIQVNFCGSLTLQKHQITRARSVTKSMTFLNNEIWHKGEITPEWHWEIWHRGDITPKWCRKKLVPAAELRTISEWTENVTRKFD